MKLEDVAPEIFVTFVLLSGDSNAYDVLTVAKISNGLKGEDGADGADGLTILLTNEAQSITTDSTGKVLANQTYTTDILVYKGATAYSFTNGLVTTTTNGITFKKASNTTVSISVSAETTIPIKNGSFTIPIVVDGITYNKVFSWSLAKQGTNGTDGTDGTDAQYVIVAGEQVFRYTNNFSGAPTPSQITLEAEAIGIDSPSYQWSYRVPGATNVTNISGATSSSFTLTHNYSIWGSHKQLTLRCTSSDKYDEITLVKVSDGANGENGQDGKDGQDAKLVKLSGEQIFKYTDNFTSNATPSTITISLFEANLTNPTRVWSYKQGDGEWQTLTNPTNANAVQYTVVPTDETLWGTSKTLSIKCECNGISDEITIVKVSDGIDGTDGKDGTNGQDGKDALTILLTNESQSFTTDTSGKVLAYQEYSTEIVVYKGGVPYTFTNSFTDTVA